MATVNNHVKPFVPRVESYFQNASVGTKQYVGLFIWCCCLVDWLLDGAFFAEPDGIGCIISNESKSKHHSVKSPTTLNQAR